MKPNERAALLIAKTQVSEREWEVVMSGAIPLKVDESASFLLFRGSKVMADLAEEYAIKLIAGLISDAMSEVWIESGVCSVCKKSKSEHPPGPPCYPRLEQRQYPG